MVRSLAKKINRYRLSLSVGFFLAFREIRRANKWTTALIIAVMVLTFLNLVVVSGILVGLVEGITQSSKSYYGGDIIISKFYEKRYIENSQDIIRFAKSFPEVDKVTWRYTTGALVEANYKDKERVTDVTDNTSAVASGIDPYTENEFGGLAKTVIKGDYLEPDDFDKILVGVNLLYTYTPIESADLRTLKNVDVGSKVRVTIGSSTREMLVKGVVKSKVTEIDQRIFFPERQLRTLMNRYDYNVNEIALRLKPGASAEKVRDDMKRAGYDRFARIQTFEEGMPKFVKDIRDTFGMLGNLIGGVGLAVASITIFIVIFVNAITRRRYIGILKGIGIDSRAIEFSYIVQSLFYACLGIIIGSLIVFFFLKPYLNVHPINFPFSDGILVATFSGTVIRIVILLIATIVAGYIPAKIVIRQNTLSAILGR